MSDPEITDPRDPMKARDLVEELNAELALIAELPYRVPIHHLARRARDEIVALRGYLAECERQFQAKVAEIGTLLDRVHQARAETLEEACRICPECANRIKALNTVGADHLRALKEKP